MKPFWGYDKQVAAWVAARIPGCEEGFNACRALGVATDDLSAMAGGIVYHDWNPRAQIMELSGAAATQRWLTRPVLWQMFSYPFIGCGCQMVVMRVSERNETQYGRGIKRILKAYGFNETRIERLFGRGEDGLVYTLTDDDWRANGFHKKEFAAYEQT